MKPIKSIDKLDKRQKKYLKNKFGISAWKDLTPTILKNLKEIMQIIRIELPDALPEGRGE